MDVSELFRRFFATSGQQAVSLVVHPFGMEALEVRLTKRQRATWMMFSAGGFPLIRYPLTHYIKVSK